MSNPKAIRTFGFRFSVTDAVVICIVIAAAGVLRRMENPLWWIVLVVVAHFFLFCNTFRIRRNFEFFWAGTFLLNVGVWLWRERLDCLSVLAIQLPITACLLLAEIRSRRYHGIFAARINPRLNDYVEGRIL
jgi:hypothetical protein